MATAPTIITNIPRELDTKQHKDHLLKCSLIQKEIEHLISTRNNSPKPYAEIFNARIVQLNREQFSIGKSEWLDKILKTKSLITPKNKKA